MTTPAVRSAPRLAGARRRDAEIATLKAKLTEAELRIAALIAYEKESK